MLNISLFDRVKFIYISQNLYYTSYSIYKNLKLNTETNMAGESITPILILTTKVV